MPISKYGLPRYQLTEARGINYPDKRFSDVGLYVG